MVSCVLDQFHFIDKTLMIRKIVTLLKYSEKKVHPCAGEIRDPILITALRCFGKTTNLEMLECFFGGIVPKKIFLSLKIGSAHTEKNGWF